MKTNCRAKAGTRITRYFLFSSRRPHQQCAKDTSRTMLRKRWFWIAFGLLSFLGLVAVAVFEPFRIVPGFFGGDAFFKMRPTRYWRELLRADGAAGSIREETISEFAGRSWSVPVLRECLKDSDRNVRWPAAHLLRRTG